MMYLFRFSNADFGTAWHVVFFEPEALTVKVVPATLYPGQSFIDQILPEK